MSTSAHDSSKGSENQLLTDSRTLTPRQGRPLRSTQWYGKLDKDGFIHRSWMKSQGYPNEAFDGRPIIGIANTWSELTPCNSHLRELADHVKRGVWAAGGFPVEFPVMSLGETQMRPTAMLFRNLLAMEVEESIRANPIDGVVLLGGCDKTTPAQIMGACSVGLPFMVISSGPMLNGRYKGKAIGSGTDVWKLSEAVRAGEMSVEEFMDAERCMSRSHGTCMTMGTASTMACISEAMGLSLPYNGTIPAVDAHRKALCFATGTRIVDLVLDDLTPSHFLTKEAFENAVKITAAIGGSTNSVVHLLAIAKRLGIDFELDDWNRMGKGVPLVVDLMPAGRFLMEDFHYAGGVPAVIRHLAHHFNLEVPTVSGESWKELIKDVESFNMDVIRPENNALIKEAGLVVLRGNLCPNGAIIKPAAATPELLQHRGKAVVFESIEDYKERIDDPNLDVDASSILVLKGCGPKGYPGMPEVGNMALPKKLLQQGIRDLVRISDARMSGTAFGTVVLHVAPEASAGGPLAFVQTGDWISLDVEKSSLTIEVSDKELQTRKANWIPPNLGYVRGYYKLYIDHVNQADQGADLDFLVGSSGSEVKRESH